MTHPDQKPYTPLLPFVVDLDKEDEHGRRRVFWRVAPTGDWCADCEIGVLFARQLFDSKPREMWPVILGWIVKDMIIAGHHSGIDCGFMTAVGYMTRGQRR
jgi:hypothetical protein